MKTLLLVRHAQAEAMLQDNEDFCRQLTMLGQEAAIMQGRCLREAQLIPQLIVTSDAVRTLETAKLLAEGLQLTSNIIIPNSRMYLANYRKLNQIIEECDDHYDCVMLVGHNPGIPALAEYLTGNMCHDFPNCGMYAVQMDIQSWQEAASGSGHGYWVIHQTLELASMSVE